jgi:hypothetical protein
MTKTTTTICGRMANRGCGDGFANGDWHLHAPTAMDG